MKHVILVIPSKLVLYDSVCLCILPGIGLDFIVVLYKQDLAYMNVRRGLNS